MADRFQFDSLAAFLAMDGHGAFIWLSYGITLLVLAWLVATPLIRARRVRAEIRRQHRATATSATEESTD
ncbi:MAG: heme exporter protein CcmD [Porticoccaceae bacterium]|jgi:heme exporter protein D|nr:heme exporter protein CcmD [Porticoccaceae bacterium]MEA3301581.1 heme exporter protein CcmD [Pseudomonadota bacterium]HLS98819.1 heme exporter protein CcmD [Porticoccaceae bacterium]